MDQIGIAGAGRMGSAFARRLRETGFAPLVWNRNAARLQGLDGVGTTTSALADLAMAPIILLALTDKGAAQAVIAGLGAEGIEGRLIVDLSTHLPDTVAALGQLAQSFGAQYLECPVGGTVAPALKGQLLGFVGGAPQDLARARPVLEALCRRIAHMGALGQGARMKLAVNLPLAIYWQTLGEALQMLQGAEMDLDLALELIAASSAGPNVMKTRAGIVAEAMTGADPKGTFDINGLLKDLRLSLQLGHQLGAQMPVADLVAQAYEAAVAQGLGGADGAVLTRLAQKR